MPSRGSVVGGNVLWRGPEGQQGRPAREGEAAHNVTQQHRYLVPEPPVGNAHVRAQEDHNGDSRREQQGTHLWRVSAHRGEDGK